VKLKEASHKDNVLVHSWSLKLNSLQPRAHHDAQKKTVYKV